jgi:hypothetical protein
MAIMTAMSTVMTPAWAPAVGTTLSHAMLSPFFMFIVDPSCLLPPGLLHQVALPSTGGSLPVYVFIARKVAKLLTCNGDFCFPLGTIIVVHCKYLDPKRAARCKQQFF